MSTPRVWLITGASSGFGLALTKVVLNHGDIAVATLRTPSTLTSLVKSSPTDRLLVLKCDVTRPQEIATVFAETIAKFGRCDVVFNNAGVGVLGEVESVIPDDQARDMFEVNFWGAVNISREAVRVFREVNPPGSGGRLIVVSSGQGLVGSPALGFYAASKHALEGLTESLAKEIDPAWNIKISILEPGAFKTKAHSSSLIQFPAHPAYTKQSLVSQQIRQWIAIREGIKGDPDMFAERIFEFASISAPPLRWVVGKDAIEGIRRKLEHVMDEIKEYESLSESLISQ